MRDASMLQHPLWARLKCDWGEVQMGVEIETIMC
jgi:hypothetical protein